MTQENTKKDTERWAPGNYLIQLRNGDKIDILPFNTYLLQAKNLTDLLFTRPELENRFPGIFPNPALPLIMEVGCYMGDTVVEMAQRNPDFNILGVDIKYKRVVKSCNKIKRAGLTNAKIAVIDARELIAIIPDDSLFGILAFFPDPWQKKRHAKNRFLSDGFFNAISKKLSAGGFVWIKTDNHSYFEETIEKAEKYGFTRTTELPTARPLIGENYRTFFEQLFIKQEKPVYQLFLRKI